jgi:hypothetical protein
MTSWIALSLSIVALALAFYLFRDSRWIDFDLDAVFEQERTRAEARLDIISEIEAFAGEYSHSMTKGKAKRDVVIVEQLIDFLRSPLD